MPFSKSAGDYRPDIDGLRAVAVVPVVLFHAGIPAFGGGFVGVDVFFVISGFLITRIIAREIAAGTFSIVNFYERRIRRIIPALVVVLAFTALMALALMPPATLVEVGRSVVAAALSVSNILFWLNTDYFAAPVDEVPLLHTWSLGVEEQYYLVFPLVLLASFRFRDGRFVRAAVVAMAAGSLLASVAFVARFQEAVFYLAPFRFWELLIGSLLAIGPLRAPRSTQVREAAAWLGLALIGASVLLYTEETLFPGAAALPPCLGAALVIYAGLDAEPTLAGRLLSSKVPVAIGLISYSLYLWHWPLIVFSGYLPAFGEGWAKAAVVLLSFLAGALSWKYVEQPFRNRPAVGRRPVFAGAGAAIGACLVFGAYVDWANGLPGRFPAHLAAEIPGKEFYNRQCLLEARDPPEAWKGADCFLSTAGSTNVLLWGDSFAAHYVPGLRAHAGDWNVLQYTASACAPMSGYDPKFRRECAAFNRQAARVIEEFDVDAVILAANWLLTVSRAEDFAGLQRTVDDLTARGIDVVVIGQVPTYRGAPQKLYAGADVDAATGRYYAQARGRVINEELEASARGALFVDPFEFADCRGESCPFLDPTGYRIVDNGHLSKYGSELIVGRYYPVIREYLGRAEKPAPSAAAVR